MLHEELKTKLKHQQIVTVLLHLPNKKLHYFLCKFLTKKLSVFVYWAFSLYFQSSYSVLNFVCSKAVMKTGKKIVFL